VARNVSLAGVLLGLWLVLSGHYTTLLISLGVVSVLLVLYAARRMGIVDSEGVVSLRVFVGLVGYVPWLLKEILHSNLVVSRVILSPDLPISPTLVHYEAGQETDLGRVIFANSITLTPGTVTTGIDGDDLQIHALLWSAVDGVEEGEMDQRVSRVEGSR